MMQRVDVAIVGAGLSAWLLSYLLALQQRRVIVVCKAKYMSPPRFESLTTMAAEILQAEGLGECTEGTTELSGVECAWGNDAPFEVPAIFRPHSRRLSVDRAFLGESVRLRAVAQGVSQQLCSGQLICKQLSPGWILQIPGKAACEIRSEFVVDATGRSAALRRLLGRRPETHGPANVALGATLVDVRRTRSRHLLIDGDIGAGVWWCSVPGPQRGETFFRVAPQKWLPRDRERRKAQWLRELSQTRLLSNLAPLVDGPKWASDATMRCLFPLAGHRWIAVGDAAFCLSPLSGSGLDEVVRSAVEASRAIVEDSETGLDAGVNRAVTNATARWSAHCQAYREVYSLDSRALNAEGERAT